MTLTSTDDFGFVNRAINQQEEEARNIKEKFEEESQAWQVKYDKKAEAVEALKQKCVMIEKNLNDALKTVSTGSRDTIRKAAVNAALEAQNNCVETRIMLESELKKNGLKSWAKSSKCQSKMRIFTIFFIFYIKPVFMNGPYSDQMIYEKV